MEDKTLPKNKINDEFARVRQRLKELELHEKKHKLTEEKLKSSQERLKIIFEYAPDGYYLSDLKGNFIDGNRAAEIITGYKREELIGKNFLKLNLLSPDQIPKAANRLAQNVLGKPTGPDEFTLRRKDGTPICVEVRTFPVKIGGKKVALGIARDITRRKQMEEELKRHREHLEELVEKRTIELRKANKKLKKEIAERQKIEKALRESEKRVRSIFEAAQDAIFAKDIHGHYTSVNSAFASMFGLSKDEVVGKKDIDLFPPEIARHIEEDIDQKVLNRGAIVSVDDQKPIKGVIRTFHVVKVPLRDTNGKIIGLSGIARDITERKDTEKALRESQRALSTLMSNLPGIAYRCQNNRDWTMEFISEGCVELTGYKPSDMVQSRKISFGKIIHPEDREQVWKDVEAAILKGRPFQLIYRIITSRGEEKWVWEQGRGIFNPKNELVALEGFITDISDRKKAEDELIEHRQHLELLNKILRHDLINDITVIKSALRLYRETKEDDFLKKADTGIKTSIDLINRMSELESFISSHKELKVYNTSDTIKSIIKSYPSIKFSLKGGCEILADDALVSVIDNILRNIAEHAKTDRVDITVQEKEGWCELRIADYGIGIPDEVKDKIFQEGFRYGETAGSGLGLFIVKKTVERYGGSVYLEDNRPRGSIFVLRLMKIK